MCRRERTNKTGNSEQSKKKINGDLKSGEVISGTLHNLMPSSRYKTQRLQEAGTTHTR